MNTTVLMWVGFNAFVLAMLALDLGLFHKKEHVVSPKEAGIWTGVWVAISLVFCAGIWKFVGPTEGMQWLTAYVIEYSLSVDNLFVFLLVFSFFKVEAKHQHRILFWGIVGAFAMRAVLIVVGAALMARFHWLTYVFGAFLVYTAVKMVLGGDDEMNPDDSLVVRVARKVLPVSKSKTDTSHFFVKEEGKNKVTSLFIVLVMVEATDLLFALDSIPAVLGISTNTFIIYTSNVCAILGLRSLFFIVSSLMEKFYLLKTGLSAILAFVGVKMLITYFDIHVNIGLSLGIIGGILLLSIVASVLWPKKPAAKSSEV